MAVKHFNQVLEPTIYWPSNGRNCADGPLSSKQTNKQTNTSIATSRALNVASFNCRSVKSSINEVIQLCNTCDIIMLQEHWLLPTDLSLLSALHVDFLATAHSAVDISTQILVGRPYEVQLFYIGSALVQR